jgi:hypothetical protein
MMLTKALEIGLEVAIVDERAEEGGRSKRPFGSTRTRDASTKRSSCAPSTSATRPAARRGNPPRKTASRASARRSSSPNSRHDTSTAARRLRCRSDTVGSRPARPRRAPPRPSARPRPTRSRRARAACDARRPQVAHAWRPPTPRPPHGGPPAGRRGTCPCSAPAAAVPDGRRLRCRVRPSSLIS